MQMRSALRIWGIFLEIKGRDYCLILSTRFINHIFISENCIDRPSPRVYHDCRFRFVDQARIKKGRAEQQGLEFDTRSIQGPETTILLSTSTNIETRDCLLLLQIQV